MQRPGDRSFQCAGILGGSPAERQDDLGSVIDVGIAHVGFDDLRAHIALEDLESVGAIEQPQDLDRLNGAPFGVTAQPEFRAVAETLVYEIGGETIIVDAGMSFPRDEHLGVDVILPDFGYLQDKRVRAVVLTHAHEDHVGALPYMSDSRGKAALRSTRPLEADSV